MKDMHVNSVQANFTGFAHAIVDIGSPLVSPQTACITAGALRTAARQRIANHCTHGAIPASMCRISSRRPGHGVLLPGSNGALHEACGGAAGNLPRSASRGEAIHVGISQRTQ
jgi:hypothetical protein